MAPELLISLAFERSSERRRELMGEVTALFLEGAERYSDRELVLFGDVLTALLDHVGEEEKERLSERVADSPHIAHGLVRRLAEDDSIAVAEPVLERSPVLNDHDLITVAREKSHEHRLALTRRGFLAEPVTDELVIYGDLVVRHCVSANSGAKLSPWGLERLAQDAALNAEIGIALLSRGDVPRETAERIFGVLPESARRRLIELSRGDPDGGQRLVDKAHGQTGLRKLGAAASRIEAGAIVAEVRAGARTLDAAVATLAGEDRFLDLSHLLAELSGLDEAVVSNILTRAEGTPLAIVARALGLSSDAFRQLVALKQRRLDLPSDALAGHIAEYRSVNRETAARAIRFVKLRSSLKTDSAA